MAIALAIWIAAAAAAWRGMWTPFIVLVVLALAVLLVFAWPAFRSRRD